MFIVKTIQWKYSKNKLSKTGVLNRQSWLPDYDSEQVLAKMSPEEYLNMSLIILSFSFFFFFNSSVFFLLLLF